MVRRSGIICGSIWGSFPIICGPGSFAGLRAVPRIFCLGGGGGGGKLHTPFQRGLPYSDRVSSWKFLFPPLRRKLPLRPLKKTKYTEFTLKGDFFSQLADFLVISDQYRYKKQLSKLKHYVRKNWRGQLPPLPPTLLCTALGLYSNHNQYKGTSFKKGIFHFLKKLPVKNWLPW